MTQQFGSSRTRELDLPENESASDEELMAAVQAGDQGALSNLYDRHVPTIYALCLRILHRDSEAEAVVSDVFLEVWRKPHSFDARRGSCRTYLLTLARSRAIDRWRATDTRKKKTHEAGKGMADAASETQSELDPSTLVETSERHLSVRTAIESLEKPQRDALVLSYFEGLTHREISERLDMPLGTVKTRIRSGLGSLRKALSALGESGGL